MKKLRQYDFTSRKDQMKIDGITYKYTFQADNKPIESHLAIKEKGIGRFYYTVRVDPGAKNLKAFAGYLYTQKPFARLRLGLSRLDGIHIPKLIEHLDRVSQGGRGRRASLEVMERMLKRYANRKKLKQSHSTELDSLIQFVEGWKLISAQDRVRQQVVAENLNKLK